MKNLSIEDGIKRKRELEKAIEELLNKFTNDTGLIINDISLDTIQSLDGNAFAYNISLKVII